MSSMQLVIAEKPAVARDLARVLGVRPNGKAAFEGRDWVITWCIGHLVELDEPAAYDPRWKAWRMDTLPMIPERFKLRASAGTKDQLRAVRELLRDGRFSGVVNACDAGREGELIFRYVYELAKSRLPIRRLWISSLTDEAIRQGFAALREGRDFDPLADAARCRSEADWLVGLNATRAMTVRSRSAGGSTLFSIGRVQTPTLAILVDRERAIRAFVPRDYWEVRGSFVAGDAKLDTLLGEGKALRLGTTPMVDEVLARSRAHGNGTGAYGPVVERVTQKKLREPPPLLFDLTGLQRTANRRFGWSAQRTLELAQALYERHKILTYPRTNARHLSTEVAKELPKLFRGLQQFPEYRPFVEPLLAEPPRLSKRIVDDSKIEDHHAIVPTGKVIELGRLDRDERRLFDLVVRRFLGAFHPDAEFALTEIVVRVGPGDAPPKGADARASEGKGPESKDEQGDQGEILESTPPPPDRYFARGRVRLVPGWQTVAGFGDGEAQEPTLPALTEGQRLDGTFDPVARQTRPPPRHTEATLLSAMEYAGRTLDDEELRSAMRDCGLGTPATRASIIETLVRRGFVGRDGKNLVPTALGMGLIEALPASSLASAELTGSWEARLARIARGQELRTGFMRDIAGYVHEIVEALRNAPVQPGLLQAQPPPSSATRPPARGRGQRGRTASLRPAAAGSRVKPPRAPKAPKPPKPPAADVGGELRCPRCRQGSLIAGKRGWGCARWREGCAFVIWFEAGGKKISPTQLRDLVEKGQTRKSSFADRDGSPRVGRLVLDVQAPAGAGAARFEPV